MEIPTTATDREFDVGYESINRSGLPEGRHDMTGVVKETIYKATFQSRIAGARQPVWLRELREKAFACFTSIGFPTPSNEEWKYTNVAAIADGTWGHLESASEDFSALIASECRNSVLVFRNGVFSKKDSNLSAIGTTIALTFSEALADEKYAAIMKSKLGSLIEPEKNGFVALNTAFIEEGAFIFLPKNSKVESPIQMLFVSDEATAAFPRVLIVAEEFAEATFVESYLRNSETTYFTNPVVEVFLAAEAKIKHFRIQSDSHVAFNVGATGAEVEKGSVYDSTNINLGAKLSRHEIAIRFNAEGGEVFADGLYMIGEDQHHDTHSLIDHHVPNCVSHQSYKGIVDGRARAVFNGKILVRENASGTDGYQSNKNLLLSNDARIDTKPQLEIFNDDVKCAHGATVGQLEDEELFYLLSRGLNEKLARNLLTYGFAEEVINKIDVDSVKKQLDESVLNRLNADFGSR
jgi:Fe-S cluster assembly protein SufD